MEKTKIFFVLGCPGSGKSTLCKRLQKELDYEHIITGDILRNIVKNKSHPKWKELHYQLSHGLFVDSKDYFDDLKKEILKFKKKILLIDGFPRSNENKEQWEINMKDNVEVLGVLYFQCSNENLVQRVLGRNEGRSDDNESVVLKRINGFYKETMNIINYYRDIRKLIVIDANQGKNEVYNEVVNKLNSYGMN